MTLGHGMAGAVNDLNKDGPFNLVLSVPGPTGLPGPSLWLSNPFLVPISLPYGGLILSGPDLMLREYGWSES